MVHRNFPKKGDPPLKFINSPKRGFCLYRQFLWIVRYVLVLPGQ